MVTAVQSMPNEVNEMIYIASGSLPRRDQCQESKISIFLIYVLSKHCQNTHFFFLNVLLKLENVP